MSEEKIPENLLLEVAYSKKSVRFSEYKDGELTWYEPRLYCGKHDLPNGCLKRYVIPPIKNLTDVQKCGITVALVENYDSDTVIRVYALPAEMQCHRVYAEPSVHECDAWLRDFLIGLNPIRMFDAASARDVDFHPILGFTADDTNSAPFDDGLSTINEFLDKLWPNWRAYWEAYPSADDKEGDEKVGKNGSTMSFASADGVHDRIDEDEDDEEIERKAYRDEFRRLELRRLRAKVIKAEIEAANAIMDSELFDVNGTVERASEDAAEYIRAWG